jgi:molybdopterin-guanine dinucleotide biosynthesis protein A
MGTDKALQSFGGGPSFIERVDRALSSVAHEIVLSGTVEDRYAFLGRRVIPDRGESSNALCGICTVLESLGAAEWVVVVACDLPLIAGMTLVRLAEIARANPDVEAVVPYTEQGGEPLAAAYSPSAACKLRHALDRGVRRIANQPPRRFTLLPAGAHLPGGTIRVAATQRFEPANSPMPENTNMAPRGLSGGAVPPAETLPATVAALDGLDVLWVPATGIADDPVEFLNINDPWDLERALSFLAERGRATAP